MGDISLPLPQYKQTFGASVDGVSVIELDLNYTKVVEILFNAVYTNFVNSEVKVLQITITKDIKETI